MSLHIRTSFRNIFNYKKDKVTKQFRALHKEEVLYMSPSVNRTVKSRRSRWAGHVAVWILCLPRRRYFKESDIAFHFSVVNKKLCVSANMICIWIECEFKHVLEFMKKLFRIANIGRYTKVIWFVFYNLFPGITSVFSLQMCLYFILYFLELHLIFSF